MSTHQAAEADVAVAEPEAPVVKPKKKDKSDPKKKPPRKQPRYHVILWNDDDHSYEYVVEMMQKLFGHPKEKGLPDRQGGRFAGEGDLLHDGPGARRAEAGPDSRLRPRQRNPPLQRINERDD